MLRNVLNNLKFEYQPLTNQALYIVV